MSWSVIRILAGVTIWVFIYVNPDARQITADALRAAGNALAPAAEERNLQDLINKIMEGEL